MPFPRKLLGEDEDVLFDAHPHWIRLVGPVAIGIVVLAACIALFVIWSSAPGWFGIVLAAVLLAMLIYVGAKVIAWRTTVFVVTTRRVIGRSGVLHRTGREIPINRVQDVTYHQGLIERIVGSGEIIVESGGDSGVEDFSDVRHPQHVQTLINQAQVRFNAPVASAEVAVPLHDPTASQNAVVQLEQLDDLRKRGIITEIEFQQKKEELLKDV